MNGYSKHRAKSQHGCIPCLLLAILLTVGCNRSQSSAFGEEVSRTTKEPRESPNAGDIQKSDRPSLQADLDEVLRLLVSDKNSGSYVTRVGDKRFDAWKSAAEQGEAGGQYLFGLAHLYGTGVEKSENLAIEWYQKSAAQDFPFALNVLAMRYRVGRGAKKDEAKSIELMSKAANLGFTLSQRELGSWYRDGVCVKKDDREAVKWFRKAAAQDNPMAQDDLGWCYANGIGVTKDENQAAIWYRKAADLNLALAQIHMGEMYAAGRGVAKDLEAAKKWFAKATSPDNDLQMQTLATLKASEIIFAQNTYEQWRWNKRNTEDEEAARIGRNLEDSLGITKTDEHLAKSAIERKLIWAHSKSINSVEFSPDGKTLATASSDLTAKIWDVETGKILATLNHPVTLNAVSFNRDGTQLATGGSDEIIRIWDVKTGKQLNALKGHSGKILSVKYSRTGDILASGSEDRMTKLWNAQSGKEIATLKGHAGQISTVAFSPSGKLLATGSSDQKVKIWEVESAKELKTLDGGGAVTGVTFGADEDRLIWIRSNKIIMVHSLTTNQEAPLHRDQKYGLTAVVMSPDGKRFAWGRDISTTGFLYTGSSAVTLAARNSISPRALIEHTQGVNDLAFSPNGKCLASVGTDGTIVLWQVDPSSYYP